MGLTFSADSFQITRSQAHSLFGGDEETLFHKYQTCVSSCHKERKDGLLVRVLIRLGHDFANAGNKEFSPCPLLIHNPLLPRLKKHTPRLTGADKAFTAALESFLAMLASDFISLEKKLCQRVKHYRRICKRMENMLSVATPLKWIVTWLETTDKPLRIVTPLRYIPYYSCLVSHPRYVICDPPSETQHGTFIYIHCAPRQNRPHVHHARHFIASDTTFDVVLASLQAFLHREKEEEEAKCMIL